MRTYRFVDIQLSGGGQLRLPVALAQRSSAASCPPVICQVTTCVFRSEPCAPRFPSCCASTSQPLSATSHPGSYPLKKGRTVPIAKWTKTLRKFGRSKVGMLGRGPTTGTLALNMRIATTISCTSQGTMTMWPCCRNAIQPAIHHSCVPLRAMYGQRRFAPSFLPASRRKRQRR